MGVPDEAAPSFYPGDPLAHHANFDNNGIVQGRYDEDTPVKTQTEPLFKILSEPKEIEIYDGGHVAPTELVVTRVGGWLDKIRGPVRR